MNLDNIKKYGISFINGKYQWISVFLLGVDMNR